jgi:iron complex outermembrane receptor protein
VVKDVSASCADKALRAQRVASLVMVALAAFGTLSSAAELPASLRLQQVSSTADTVSIQGSAGPHLFSDLPALEAADLLSTQASINQQELSFPVGSSLELNVAMGGSDESSAFSQEYAGTTGIWTPVESLSFKAGIGVSQQHMGNDAYMGLPAIPALCAVGSSNTLNCLAAGSGNESSAQTYMIGASWRAFGRVSVSLDYTTSNMESNPSDLGTSNLINSSSLIEQIGQPSATLASRTQALDFSLSCDIGGGNWGDLELGLQVSRIMTDGNLTEPGFTTSNLTDPYTQASLGVGWQLGDFRSDFTSRYLDVLDGQGNSQTPWTSLDVNFSWRTPWNASLSVGARNVFNNPAPETSGLNDPNVDELFGRVPYVRYRQDL